MAKKGAKLQASGRSRRDRTVKMQDMTEGYGGAVAFILSPGNCADISAAHALLDKMPLPTCLLAYKRHDANSLRGRLDVSKTEIVTHPTRSRKKAILSIGTQSCPPIGVPK